MQRLHHVGYWVDDLDSALTRWNTDLGVGPFQVIEHVPFEEFVLIVDGQRDDDVVFDHSAAFAAWGPVVVELGQVHAIDDRLAAAYGINGIPGRERRKPRRGQPRLVGGAGRRAGERAARPAGVPADQHGAVGPDLGRLARRRAAVPAPDRAAPAQRRHRRHARPPGRAAPQPTTADSLRARDEPGPFGPKDLPR